MSMTETIGRVQQIQLSLVQLTTGQPVPPSASASSTATTGALAGSAAGIGSTGAANGSAGAFADVLAAVNPAASASASGAVSPGAGLPDAGNATGADFVESAKKYIGVPYVWGGEDATGMDCSGFVQRAFADMGIDMPRLARAQMDVGTPVASFAEARPGDLISSFNGDHISIYLGNGKAIDAPVPGKTIQIRDAWEMDSNLEKIVRILPSAESVPPAGTGAAPDAAVADLVAAARAAMINGGTP